jgi:pimeloyl-ACP methyl ester carboxylesterase
MRIPRALPAVALAASTIVVPAADRASADSGRRVVDRAVEIGVRNLDRTEYGPTELQTCPADPATQGATWTVRARLVAPRDVLRRRHRAITVDVHGLAADGQTSFHLQGVDGYDHATELARRGHASLVIDRIGYGASTRPDGRDVCTGAGADIVHQVVEHLRAGDYGGPSFERVAVAGFSAGGLFAEVEASTFRDVDALAVLSYEDQGFRPFLLGELGKHAQRCADASDGYAPTFDDRDDPAAPADRTAAALLSPDAARAVVDAVVARHAPDPCGEDPGPYIASNPGRLAAVTTPVLLVYGEDDALFDASLAPQQAAHFTGSRDVTTVVLPHTAHLLMLERTAPRLRDRLAAWLDRHGL